LAWSFSFCDKYTVWEILEKVFGYILILFVEAVIIVGSYQKGRE